MIKTFMRENDETDDLVSNLSKRVRKLNCNELSSIELEELNSTFRYAVHLKKLKFAQIILDAGAQINQLNDNGLSILHEKARVFDQTLIDFLLGNGADINNKGFYDETPIFSLINGKALNKDNLEYLISKGACITQLNNAGENILHLLIKKDNDCALSILAKDEIEIDKRTGGRSDTELSIACRYNAYDVIKVLLEKGADINALNSSGLTPLMRATQREDIKMVNFLLDNKANINIRALEGGTFMDILRVCDNEVFRSQVKKTLLKRNRVERSVEYNACEMSL